MRTHHIFVDLFFEFHKGGKSDGKSGKLFLELSIILFLFVFYYFFSNETAIGRRWKGMIIFKLRYFGLNGSFINSILLNDCIVSLLYFKKSALLLLHDILDH